MYVRKRREKVFLVLLTFIIGKIKKIVIPVCPLSQ